MRYMANISLKLMVDKDTWDDIVRLMKRQNETEGRMLVRLIEEKLKQEMDAQKSTVDV
jgi:EAL domain-containing protein (putative c-di-GMP-specific phosphodiesterase class I)